MVPRGAIPAIMAQAEVARQDLGVAVGIVAGALAIAPQALEHIDAVIDATGARPHILGKDTRPQSGSCPPPPIRGGKESLW